MDRSILIDAIERSIFWVPDVPGRVERLSIPGLEGYTMASPHPLGTLVGRAAMDGPQTDLLVGHVRETAAAAGKGVTWVIGPSTTPPDLPDRLTASGFTQVWDMAGMALTDLRSPAAGCPTPGSDAAAPSETAAPPGLEIRMATAGDLDRVARTSARGFDMPLDLLTIYAEARLTGCGPSRTNVYLAYVDGVQEPVAYANLDYVPGEPVCRLGGAATLGDHRGRGVYSSLVARRLADARALGMTAAVIQAQRETSAPICRKLGFQEVCPMTAYSWQPPETT